MTMLALKLLETRRVRDARSVLSFALFAVMAGFLQDRWGWQPLNWFSVLLMLAAAAAVIWLRYQRASLSPVR